MNIDYPQAYCNTCGETPADVEIDDTEIVFYDLTEVKIQFTLLYCVTCAVYKIVFNSD